MTNDYDLVVMGSTPEAIYSASRAAYLKARVALVQQPTQFILDSAQTIFSRRFTHVTHLFNQLKEIYPENPQFNLPLTGVTSWAKEVNRILSEINSPAMLSALGVDVIMGSGELVRLPSLSVVAEGRKLRSQAYLLATGASLSIPKIEGLEEVGYLTPEDLWHPDKLAFLPHQLVIVGSTPMAIELAQNLQRLGKDVSLVVEHDQIFPSEDPEAVALLQSILESEGIKIYLQRSLSQVRRIEGKKWLQVGNYALETDEIIIATQPQPNVAGLNLEGVGVKWGQKGILVNEKLQTTNTRIYACGSLLGGYHFTHLAQYEAQIALKNALFFPRYKVDYGHIPYTIFTDPPLARVGMTEAQAKRRYGEKVQEIGQRFKYIAQAHILGETTGFCKLIVSDNGQILGGHIIGTQAEEFMGVIALAIQQKIKIGKLMDLVYPYPSLSEILHQIAFQWQYQHLEKNKGLQNWLENWFIWRRCWFP
ncbi:dihydrolipoyl dehydrogenase family protein [Gloeothece verrucosa]|uniref:Pyridine nucleotide-disulfide oxidoreductase dimerization region n=1 Tax=Gloeothece verrucosa (strain PCC 7822) TaxID=497965 RepID=E0UER8_GLOV7|nr:NAD(P)/FAD-dependent oxidoreductase [Gloeothece verrucosa]ADN13048.1 pyridine nucleotide-disulfide oxidoreductase dimerization region [Gloeothece verrucosa PCC 7822]